MVSPPAATPRRALIAAVWLTVAFAGLIAAVWAVGWAFSGTAAPSLDSVAEATHLAYPDSTDVVDADLAEMHTPTPGSRGEATVDIPAADFGAFIADNGMDAPLLSGATPAGAATGIIPAGCTDQVCYAATILVEDDTVTVDLRVTLL
ncbi:MAG TPA: hypothetical protein VFU12_04585 [Glycomyces sp.]|nr:hypothetical protein [Glycomyces sp.]